MDLIVDKETSFIGKKFIRLNYSNKKIEEKEFEDCMFEKCIFIETIFQDCHFTDCVFSECTLSANKPFNSVFTNVSFKDSKVMGFDWTKAKTIRLLKFERCDISYSNFSFLKLPHLQLLDCTAKEINFAESDLSEGIFTKTDFENSVFSHTNLTKADFRKAINYGIDFNFNTLKKAKFSLPEATSLLKSLDIMLEV